jgi:hypothetical protein
MAETAEEELTKGDGDIGGGMDGDILADATLGDVGVSI